MKPTIAILNRSTIIQDNTLFSGVVAALQKQVSGDFAPLWGRDADLVYVPQGAAPPQGSWQVVCADTVPMAGALGYHDFTAQGMPIGKVGIGTSKRAGSKWESTLGHEVLEMLADPDIVRTAFIQQTPMRAMIFAYEVCDAVEADQFGYQIDGVPMTDFVTEQWFEPSRIGVPFSFRGTVKRPLTLSPGGYISVYRTGFGGRWSQITARAESYGIHGGDAVVLARGDMESHVESYAKLPQVGSRRERRARSRIEWLTSHLPVGAS
jgi:hypothetical protein